MNYPSRWFIISPSLQQHPGSMYDIFLSYSTQDRERLMPLVRALEQQGWTVFWDHLSIQIGEDWRDKIEQAVCNCRCVVVAWSKDSIKSKWVREEATEGESRNALLPIRIDHVNPPFGFRSLQAGNFVGWDGGAGHFEFVRLANQIRALVGDKVAMSSASPAVSVAPTIITPAKPAWASAAGDDQYGRYADLNVKGVNQRFRRIEPGTFLMGSPLSEPGRSDDEIQHEVTLTQGFWLADTACTQALWQVVIGGNPSVFKGKKRPVDSVSWDDAQGFIQKLNSRVTGLNLRLPTEAEWEYACRAGTTTPFSFGGNIIPEQVNYDGNYPYVGGKKGLNRKKTVTVKSLLGNSWGLYEMHGNVWEWCQGWYGDYLVQPVVDPQGAEAGIMHVARGGSWRHYGRSVRSAIRNGLVPDDHHNGIGFRLALGH